MAQTTTHFKNSSVVFTLDDATGTPVAIGGSTTTASLSSSPGSSGSVYTFDGDNPIQGVAKRNFTLTVGFVMSTTTTESANIFQDWAANKDGEQKTASIAMPDATTNSFQWSGEWLLTDMELPADAADATPAIASATLISNGAIAFTVL